MKSGFMQRVPNGARDVWLIERPTELGTWVPVSTRWFGSKQDAYSYLNLVRWDSIGRDPSECRANRYYLVQSDRLTHLERQVDRLQASMNREVTRRRAAEAALRSLTVAFDAYRQAIDWLKGNRE